MPLLQNGQSYMYMYIEIDLNCNAYRYFFNHIIYKLFYLPLCAYIGNMYLLNLVLYFFKNIHISFFCVYRACVPQDTFNRLKKQWKDLQRRHGEFRRVMLAGVQQVPIGEMSFASINMGLDATFLPNISCTEQVSHPKLPF